MLYDNFLRFSDPETQLFSVILQLWSLESLATQTLTSHRALDTRPLPDSLITFYVGWNFFIIAMMVEMGIFTAPALYFHSLFTNL